MINLNFYWALAAYIIMFILLLVLPWLFTSKHRDRDVSVKPKFIWFCSICTYTYINTREEDITICPRCGSYNKKSK